MKKRVIFMGTPDFSVPSLEALFESSDVNVVGVFTRLDSAKGRGRKVSFSPVKSSAIELEIPVFQPRSKDELVDQVKELNPTLIVVIAYGVILPKCLTDSILCVNLHASLLPKYRGASPIHAALLANDKESGVTLIRMNELMDEGNEINKVKISVKPSDDFGTLHDRLAVLSATVLKTFLSKLFESDDSSKNMESYLIGNIQKSEGVSYCRKLDKATFELKSTDSLDEKLGKIKAFSPVPGAYVFWKEKRVKIIKAEVIDGKIKPLLVKPEGKKLMTYHDFCLGHKGEELPC
ncbi:methionyl-tRNA formyltransferase [bacterium]|jgi:methionyl-tRNA formyltransferase|nr:methionyl-tRNA formyltransferase [bacterium]